MLIENLTVEEYKMLEQSVKHQLSYHEDNAYRYKLDKGDYPAQDSLNALRSLARKLRIGG